MISAVSENTVPSVKHTTPHCLCPREASLGLASDSRQLWQISTRCYLLLKKPHRCHMNTHAYMYKKQEKRRQRLQSNLGEKPPMCSALNVQKEGTSNTGTPRGQGQSKILIAVLMERKVDPLLSDKRGGMYSHRLWHPKSSLSANPLLCQYLISILCLAPSRISTVSNPISPKIPRSD